MRRPLITIADKHCMYVYPAPNVDAAFYVRACECHGESVANKLVQVLSDHDIGIATRVEGHTVYTDIPWATITSELVHAHRAFLRSRNGNTLMSRFVCAACKKMFATTLSYILGGGSCPHGC